MRLLPSSFLVALSAALLACTPLTAQITITLPYNPDINGDQAIAMVDLLGILEAWGDVFPPDEVLVDGVPLPDYLETLMDSTLSAGLLPEGNALGEMLQWDGETWQPVPGLAGCNDPEAFNYTAESDGSVACWSCEPVTFDGYTYSVVEVADQCWFAENLRSTHYDDGTPIPVEQGIDEWAASNSDLRCVHTANPTNETLYGQLYNFRAVTSPHGLCPSGWSVPSQA